MPKIRTRLALIAMIVAAGGGTVAVAAPAAFADTGTVRAIAVHTPQAPAGVTGSTNIDGPWRMNDNQSVSSPDGTTKLEMLRGVLEVWRDGEHVWTAGQSTGGNYVEFQTDGNLVVYRNDGLAVWASNTSNWCGESGCHLTIENGGNVAVEDDVVFVNYWETGTDR